MSLVKYGDISYPNVLCIHFLRLSSRFLMKHYSHNTKLSAYAIAVVYNLVNDTYDSSHLEYIVRNVDIMNLIYSRGLSEEGGNFHCFSSF